MNKEQIKLFDDYAIHYHNLHREQKDKRDLEFWESRIDKCETFNQILSLETTIVNAVDWYLFVRLKKYINEKMKYLINKIYIEKPLTLTQKIKNLFK